jgi:hypothetical protein
MTRANGYIVTHDCFPHVQSRVSRGAMGHFLAHGIRPGQFLPFHVRTNQGRKVEFPDTNQAYPDMAANHDVYNLYLYQDVDVEPELTCSRGCSPEDIITEEVWHDHIV